MKTTWIARNADGEATEAATTKRELIFLLTSTHLDDRKRVATKGHGRHLYLYVAPAGQTYTITREDIAARG